jgi:orotate phosphoribosyltransferase
MHAVSWSRARVRHAVRAGGYKGITLAAAVAIEFGTRGRPVPFAYNRKEAKITEREPSSSAHHCGDARSSSMM